MCVCICIVVALECAKNCINTCTSNRSINRSAFNIKKGHIIKNNEKAGARHKMQRFVQPWASGGNDPRLQRPTTLAGEPSRGTQMIGLNTGEFGVPETTSVLQINGKDMEGHPPLFKRCNGLKMMCFKQKISSWVIDGLDFPAKHCDKKANDAALVVLASNCIRLETRDFFFRIGKIADQNRTIDALVIARANNLKQKWSNQRHSTFIFPSFSLFPRYPFNSKKKKVLQPP